MSNSESRRENTLTDPSERTQPEKDCVNSLVPPLTDDELFLATKQLNNIAFVERFPEVERRFVDPAVDLQKIGLISFVPAKGATPNEKGIYGFAKLRGNYASVEEASERAEYLIRNVDSYHQIYHTYVGRPFPMTVSSDFSKEVSRVDLQKETSSSISDDVRKKREKEQQEIEEIRAKEQELLADVKKEKEDMDDHYTTLCVKKAQLTWTYSETDKKMAQMVGLIAKARHELKKLDEEHPELRLTYMNKYMDARRKSGLSVDSATNDSTFVRYMVEDLQLPTVDAEYERLYGAK